MAGKKYPRKIFPTVSDRSTLTMRPNMALDSTSPIYGVPTYLSYNISLHNLICVPAIGYIK
jgi:hypothetical protein